MDFIEDGLVDIVVAAEEDKEGGDQGTDDDEADARLSELDTGHLFSRRWRFVVL